MKQVTNNSFVYWSKVIVLGVILGTGLQFAQAWTEPTLAPPGGNVEGPLTVGSQGQWKEGNLMLNIGKDLNGNGTIGDIIGELPTTQAGLIVSNGAVNAHEYCDEDGENCSTPPFGGGGGGSSDTDWTIKANGDIYNDTGNVGIGTRYPRALMELYKDDVTRNGSVSFFPEVPSSGDFPGEMVFDGGSDSVFALTNKGSSLGKILLSSYDGMYRKDNLVITNTGNVGIGTTDPGAKLEVNGKIRSNSTANDDIGTTVVTKDYVDARILTPTNVSVNNSVMTGHHGGCNPSNSFQDANELMACNAACNRVCSDGCNGDTDPPGNPRGCRGGNTDYTFRGGIMVESSNSATGNKSLCSCWY